MLEHTVRDRWGVSLFQLERRGGYTFCVFLNLVLVLLVVRVGFPIVSD
jgi:hypothetical protein